MKNARKLLVVVLCMALVVGMSTVSFAAEDKALPLETDADYVVDLTGLDVSGKISEIGIVQTAEQARALGLSEEEISQVAASEEYNKQQAALQKQLNSGITPKAGWVAGGYDFNVYAKVGLTTKIICYIYARYDTLVSSHSPYFQMTNQRYTRSNQVSGPTSTIATKTGTDFKIKITYNSQTKYCRLYKLSTNVADVLASSW